MKITWCVWYTGGSQGTFKLGKETFSFSCLNFILDLHSQCYQLRYGVEGSPWIQYFFWKWIFCLFCDLLNVAPIMLHALLHLHLVNVMSSSFPINTLLPVKKKMSSVTFKHFCFHFLCIWYPKVHRLPEGLCLKSVSRVVGCVCVCVCVSLCEREIKMLNESI